MVEAFRYSPAEACSTARAWSLRSTRGCFDCGEVAAAAAGDEVVAEGDAEKFVQIRLIGIHCDCELHWKSGTATVPSVSHSKACRFAAARLGSEGNLTGHSVLGSALTLRFQRFGLLSSRRSVEIGRSGRRHEAKANNCVEVTLGWRLPLLAPDSQLSPHFDACLRSCPTASPDGCRTIRIQATYFSGAMEGHSDCKLIGEVESSCEAVICPSMEICRSCKVS